MKRLYLYRWLIGAFFLAVVVLIITPQTEQQTINPISKITRDSDYFMEDIVIKKYDLSGELINTLSADRMEHSIAQDTSTLVKPKITFGDKHASHWQLTSVDGELKEGNSIIRMKQRVNIDETRNGEANFTNIITHDLIIDLDSKMATTENPVTIQSKFYENSSEGLKIDFENEKIYLKSNVKTTIYQKEQ